MYMTNSYFSYNLPLLLDKIEITVTKSISANDLNEALKSKTPPLVFDVRKKPVFDSDPRVIQDAKWQIHDEVEKWAKDIPQDSQVIIYCVHGHEISKNAALNLQELGINAAFLEGGIAGWTEAGFSVS